uniref:Cytochrome P450 n=1 Tax=Panagrolaimus davidi TaxID=227884 RepID=A0A914QVC4_9BILA
MRGKGITFFSLYLRHRCNYFATRNIPQPPVTSYFLGNLYDLEKDGAQMERLREWDTKYGKIFGIMEGSHRVIVTSDVNILHEVFVKQFPTFQSRKIHATFVIDQKSDPRLNLFLAEGKKWKRLRGLITSALTVKKIKQIDPIIKQATHELLDYVRENRVEHNLNIQPTLLDASFAVIARSILGIHEKMGESKYIGEVLEALSMKETSKSWIKSFFAGTYEFRIITRFLHFLTLLTSIGAILRLKSKCEQMITKREKESEEDRENRQQDFIDFLRESQEEIDTSGDSNLMLREPKKLTRDEVIGTALLFLIAGGDTTSNLIGFCLYELAKHPEYQYMILQEIKDCIESEDDINYTSIKELSFLDRFMKEVSRIHPVGFPVLARRAVEDTTLTCSDGKHIKIEKGVCIFANAPVIHMDKEIWGEDADKFDPDRFLPEHSKDRHPMALLTFGAGPRICPGKNLAVYEVKHFIVYLLREFKIEMNDETKLNEITRTLLCPETMNLSFIPWNL